MPQYTSGDFDGIINGQTKYIHEQTDSLNKLEQDGEGTSEKAKDIRKDIALARQVIQSLTNERDFILKEVNSGLRASEQSSGSASGGTDANNGEEPSERDVSVMPSSEVKKEEQ
jgi:hypothetical protein